MPHTLKVLDYHHHNSSSNNVYTSRPSGSSITWLLKKAKLAYSFTINSGTGTLTVLLSDGTNTIEIFKASASSNISGAVEMCTGDGSTVRDLYDAVIDYSTAYLTVDANTELSGNITYQFYLSGDEQS